jgi:hypothetical protein
VALAMTLATTLAPASARAQGDAWGLVMQVARAQQLATQALMDIQTPVGAVLSRISPGGAYASGDRGLGYWSLSLGATGMEFEITNPDYTEVGPDGSPASITGPFGAAFADVELGLFSGYNTDRLHQVGSVDLLLRAGATLGDQERLAEDVQLDSIEPILGAGLRLGLLRGEGLPAVSVSAGWNFFLERTFRVQAEESGETYDIVLDFDQDTMFLIGELSKQFSFITPYGGGGLLWHHLQADYTAEVVYSTGTAGLADQLATHDRQELLYGGLELGSGVFRLVGEGGTSGGDPFGTVFLRFTR